MTYWRRLSTEDETEEHFSLSLSGLLAIRIAFGDIICNTIENSPTYLPKSIDSGCVFKLTDMLFPFISLTLLCVITASYEDRKNITIFPKS
ncbi:uncharacterized protein N7500_009421 [Penicillium coprophilum]|uniref:uncharacterized protein n=1 Tax=Penicillium coprophilum TaxID=36646 RepID=UPI00238BA25B|nr:uncharacterized protein N7500_009421 [Penicillium coprophilum]KAJ5153982.1 hypothetical protein N7500_009421 [Penicillium coprophilum]